MPPLRALLQRLVVAFLVLLDQPLQADVPPDLIAKMVALKKQQQPRDAPVAVAKRMNTKKVEIETSQRYQRMDPAFFETPLPVRHQRRHIPRGLACGHRVKTHPLPSVGEALDDVALVL